ncbi:MAG: ATP-dependent protease ATPase subunit HslU [Clostridiales bacterium]|jgi:ATP-dependent HslUV protease ATP-binding subunit HslU|nr:ATP-dependent protease ATPase subunit HslU [Clostridiales bacterium]
MNLTPKQIVNELNRYIIGQEEAKKAVAIALRTRYRRSRLSDELKDEITPKNIIMKGPTGVGKTEIARRLAKLVKAPFLKVEATKYTEVGYVGRDVESMVRDLVEVSVRLVREEKMKEVEGKAKQVVDKRLCEVLLPIYRTSKPDTPDTILRSQILADLEAGRANEIMIEIEIEDTPRPIEVIPGTGAEIDLSGMLGGFFPRRKKRKKMSVRQAREILINEESGKLIDNDSVNSEAIKRAEQNGIIFIDEIDKIAGKSSTTGPDVSREGVQRDILPIVEGCTVSTKYGNIKTDYILFIAAGAFHVSKVEDLIPELQGRFPIIVELSPLTKQDFYNILTVPENALTKQYATLLKVDNVNLSFTEEALLAMAEIAEEMNESSENIGARRLHTIMELLLEDISYNAGGDHPIVDITIDKDFVLEKLGKSLKNRNLKKFII